jgi:hypothetical protein
MQDQWLGGFLAGYNILIPWKKRGPDFFENELSIIPSAISGYCRNHYGEKLAKAVFVFIKSTRKEWGFR